MLNEVCGSWPNAHLRYGWSSDERICEGIGFNSRLDELQAAVLLALLPHLDPGNRERRAIAARYRDCLTAPGLVLPPDRAGSVYHQFAVTHPARDALRRHLGAAGIGTAVHYAPGLHRHPAFRGVAADRLPVTDALAASLLSLPIQRGVAGAQVERIARAVAASPAHQAAADQAAPLTVRARVREWTGAPPPATRRARRALRPAPGV